MIVYVWHYIATQGDLVAFMAILAIQKEYLDLTEKKQTDTREAGTPAKSQDELAYTKSIRKSQDKIGSPPAIKKELQRPCHRVLSFEKIKRNKKECKGHARGKK